MEKREPSYTVGGNVLRSRCSHYEKQYGSFNPTSDYISGVCVNHSVLSYSLQSHGLQPTRLFHPWNSPGKKIGVGCHALLQGQTITQKDMETT